jgi:hypothetical protein
MVLILTGSGTRFKVPGDATKGISLLVRKGPEDTLVQQQKNHYEKGVHLHY